MISFLADLSKCIINHPIKSFIMKNLVTIIIMAGVFSTKAQQFWQPLRADQWPDYSVFSLYADNEENIPYMGGNFKYLKGSGEANLLLLNGIAMWDGVEYSAMGVGQEWCYNVCNPIWKINKYKSKIYVGLGYSNIDRLLTYGIARWDGISWDSVTSGFKNATGSPFGVMPRL